MSTVIAKFRPWKVVVNGATRIISVLSTDSPDAVGGAGGGGYMGEYDSTKTYYGGQWVKKTTGSPQGFFAVQPGKTADSSTPPTFPADPSGPWDCTGLPFQIVGVCSNGEKDIYVQASFPF